MANTTEAQPARLVGWAIKRVWKAAHESAINEPTIAPDDPKRGKAAPLQQTPKFIEPLYQAVTTDPKGRAWLCNTDEKYAMYFKVRESWTKKKILLGKPVPADPLDPKIIFEVALHPNHRLGNIDESDAVLLLRKILMDLVDYAKRFESWVKD
ncbi:hypothetical protein CLAFUW4_02193 [Fulvia fulva]|uniref:Uncharacterized protein n=1 Tax=Passalora fulva TaxID=5499 RepID=A0A9Q8P3E4_PASFU|nr:uncharacterized protein CLAFUR5_02184 [Fulvia fulva]KAK4635887.1 hypothetical protein CLAFUR4_02188 [Fulvia fulva]KAK4637412.1 hypothetical protein CLAFUR0_02191 [Fulvia fulva]UJO11671.1 hypothetical protein CLAFUR5_02184 [Fulvia fulva]WPV09164.1 hypothetical protein CLAFUW4_02193 [Fulvia fulva]WPV23425.1 hypothetical protein CLAFUW7_02193 [Fulvia fulva]